MDKNLNLQVRAIERRKASRLEVAVATRLDSESDGRIGVTLDLSRSGARLLCVERPEPGQAVELWFLTPTPFREVQATGRVVRADPFSVGGPWRCVMAVEFDEPLALAPEEFVGEA